jgi:hypothetical protein
MSYAARRRLLLDRLTWAPSRGPKRRALIAELRQLVRDELQREVSVSADRQPRDLFDPPSIVAVPDTVTPEARLYPEPPYWVTQ